jgi:hypothetical protein
MRGLSDRFMDHLGNDTGLLNPITQRLRQDTTLDLQIRSDYINIYYRGGNLMKLSLVDGAYISKFDTKYRKDPSLLMPALPDVLKTRRDVVRWVDAFQHLKLLMDVYFSTGKGAEREAQQLIVRDNNRGKMGTATDYFICDIEYARKGARFDLVGVHWPSTGVGRKRQSGHRLVLMELKFGDGSLKGSAGVTKHAKDFAAFLDDEKAVTAMKDEMAACFNQKRELKLINCPKRLISFSDEPPLLMLILVNHDPDSTKLRNLMDIVPDDMQFATANFMGYGLFEPAVMSKKAFAALGKKRV